MDPSLTFAQRQSLNADIRADQSLAALIAANDVVEIARIYNLDAAPDFFVWRTRVFAKQIMENGFVWTAVDGLTVGKARIWEWLTTANEERSFNPSKQNVRQGLGDCFGNGSAMMTAMLPHLQKKASRVERFFATGTGTSATPGTMISEGPITYSEISTVLAGDP